MGAKQSSSILPISSNMISVESSPHKHHHSHNHNHHHQQDHSQSNNSPKSHHYHQNNKKQSHAKTPQQVIESFNSIPTHLSSSSRSEDVYCDSSNCSSTHDDIQSCNSSETSSLDESCVSSSVCTADVISISDPNFLKYRPSQQQPQQHHYHNHHHSNTNYRPSQYKKSHETNQSYPVILPSHESSKKQAFENNISSFPHKSLDYHAQLRRIQSERCGEPLLNPSENTIQSAHFPTTVSPNNKNNSTSIRSKSNKVHCILQLNCEEELERNTIDNTESSIRKSYSPNRSPSYKETLINQRRDEVIMRMNSTSSLCPPSEGGAFACW